MRGNFSGALCVLLVIGSGACGGGGGGGSSPPATAIELAISPQTASVPLGTIVPFASSCTYSDGHVGSVTAYSTWSSSNTTVATIDALGRAHTLTQGTTTITAEYASLSVSTDLAVVAPVLASIAITPQDPNVPRGSTQQLTALGTFTDGSTLDLTTTAIWSSNNAAVASVDAGGLVHANQIGSTSILASQGGISGSTSFTVVAPPLVALEVTPHDPSIPRGLPVSFTATGTYSDASTQDITTSVTWTSSAPAVATITQNGVATTLTAGTTTIRAVLAGIEHTSVLTVLPEALVSIQVIPLASKLERGSTRAFTALGTYTNQSVHDLTALATWTSSDPTIGEIVPPHSARGVLPGLVTIRATQAGITGEAGLHVYLPILRSGQTVCYDTSGTLIPCAGTGQDGEFRAGAEWPSPRFVVGQGVEAGTITDLLTGLQWKGAPDGQTAWAWLTALATASAMTDHGHDDWRLPTRREIRALVHNGWAVTADWLQGQGFSVVGTDWWTCTTLAILPSNAWNVDMYWGGVDVYDKAGGPRFWAVRTANESARCRAAQTGQVNCYDAVGNVIPCAGTAQDGELRPGVRWPTPRFTVGTGAAADIVTDELTGLEWLRSSDGVSRTWQQALDYSNGLVAGGRDDWRLPNVLELETLYNAGVPNGAAWLDSQGFTGTSADYYWASTTLTIDPVRAWMVRITHGYLYFEPKTTTHKAWPVRGP